MTVAEARRRLAAGDLDGVRAEVRAAFAGGAPAEPEWARLCEHAGMSEHAVQAWRAVLAGRPDDAEALEALQRLHDLRGDRRRAEECRRRLVALGRAPALVAEAEPDLSEPGPSAGDLVRFVHLFGGRAGVHARMWVREGEVGWSPVHAPLEPALVEGHLRGEVTLGSYLVRQGDVCGQVVFDLDVTREALARVEGHPERVRDLAERLGRAGIALRARLAQAGVPCLLVDSGYKGRHARVFLDPPAPAGAARRWALTWAAALAPRDADFSLEVFPKQDAVPAGGLGNLVKLPLGLHLRTGRRCALLDEEGRPVSEPFSVLRAARAARLDALPLPGAAAAAVAVAPSAAPADALPALAAPPPPPFTEADFEARPRLAALLSGCAVIREVVRRALADLRISHDERVVLENTLGHWPEGVQAVNFVLDRVGADEGRMGRPLQGPAASCKGVRRRLAEVADRVGCDCRFDVPETYPSPLLHARDVPADPPAPAPDLDELVERLGRLEARARAIEAELAELRTRTATALRAAPGGRHRTEAGVWWVEDVEGLAVVRFAPEGGG